MNTVVVKDRQTLLDIAIQTGGSVETVVALAEANGLGVTDDLTDGQELVTVSPVEPKIVTTYAIEGIEPATAIDKEVSVALLPDGIGYMGIEIDFRVS